MPIRQFNGELWHIYEAETAYGRKCTAVAEPAPSPATKETPRQAYEKWVREIRHEEDIEEYAPMGWTVWQSAFDAGAKSVVAAPQLEIAKGYLIAEELTAAREACFGDPVTPPFVRLANAVENVAELLREGRLAGAAALPSAQNQISQQGDSMKLIAALEEIAAHKPKTKPADKDGAWGNEDDAEYHGFKSASWGLGIIAERALADHAANENENGSTAEMVWLQQQIAEGRGEVRFGYTNDGDVGVWLGSEVNAAGAGDYAEDAIRIAMRRELPSPPVPSKEPK